MTKVDVLALSALTPVLLVLVLMTVAGWSAVRAGAVAAVVTLILAVSAFGFGGPTDQFTVISGTAGVAVAALYVALGGGLLALAFTLWGFHRCTHRQQNSEVLAVGIVLVRSRRRWSVSSAASSRLTRYPIGMFSMTRSQRLHGAAQPEPLPPGTGRSLALSVRSRPLPEGPPSRTGRGPLWFPAKKSTSVSVPLEEH